MGKSKLVEEFLREGTWALRPEHFTEAIQRLDDLKKWLYGKFGDDLLFDHLDDAIQRIAELKAEAK